MMPRGRPRTDAASGPPAKAAKGNGNGANLGFEAQLFLAADKLRKNLEPSDYKHVALGLIFLKHISNAFEAKHAELVAEDPSAAEDPDEYLADNIFWVPKEARWSHLQASAKQPTIGKLIDDAMAAIEAYNTGLKGVLPKDYNRPALDKVMVGELIDLVSGIGMGEPGDKAKDILGRVYEYFLNASPALRVSAAASSTRQAQSCVCWSKCWSRTRVASMTPAAAPAACSFNLKNSSRATVVGSVTSPSTGRRAITRRG